MLKLKFLPIIILPFLLTGFASGQELEKVLTAKTFTNARGENLPYRLFVPANYDRLKKYPLIVFLHGSGGLGNDNLKQLQLGNLYLIDRFTQSESQSRYPAFVVAPQSIGEGWVAANDRITPSRQLRLAVELIDDLRRTYSIDSGRLYVAGQSLGGFGTFAIISAYPQCLRPAFLSVAAAMNRKPQNTKARRSGSFTVRRTSRCRSQIRGKWWRRSSRPEDK